MSDEQLRLGPVSGGRSGIGEQGKSRQIITLLSDFGTEDNSVAVMKGVILGINPEVQIVDISHSIEPHCIEIGTEILSTSYHYFPKGTIHVVVVDPGVGGDRRGILVAAENYFFVGPDNGIFSNLYESPGFKWVRVLRNANFFLEKISSTFHGRDIFSPVAGYLSLGEDPKGFGPSITNPLKLQRALSHVRPGGDIDGEVVYIDHFGNLITNIDTGVFENGESLAGNGEDRPIPHIEIAGAIVHGLSRNYQESGIVQFGAHFNSWSRLEIFFPEGRASDELNAGRGTPIKVRFVRDKS